MAAVSSHPPEGTTTATGGAQHDNATPASAATLETLASYLPGLVVDRFSGRTDVALEPFEEGLDAVVLFADISGFTELTERLALEGPEGEERLTRTLNSYFSQLIDAIHDHGGDIVKFAGDALLAMWPASTAAAAERMQAAAACALAMAGGMQRGGDGAADAPELSLSIGVSHGALKVAHLGGLFGHWEVVVAGPPVVEAGLAEQRAAPGEVMLTAASYAQLQGDAAGEPVDGFVRLSRAPRPTAAMTRPAPPLTPGMEQALRGYIPDAIVSWALAGQTAWAAELRRVTTIFVNLPGIDHQTSLQAAQQVFHEIQESVYRYEGLINKISVDDKGVSVLAALGLPPFAHHDDAIRGINVALLIRERLQQLAVPFAIGVASGRAFCGSVGNAARREYTMIGNVVNLAARLMQAAPGGILCDPYSVEVAEQLIEFDERPPLELKGFRGPRATYAPARRRLTSSRAAAPMVGRVEEQRVFRAKLDQLRTAATSALVMVAGGPGIGKSRLVEAFLDAASGVKALRGSGDSVERSTPYHAWRGVFAQLFGLETDATGEPAQRRAHIEAQLRATPEHLQLAPLLEVVLPLEWSDNEFTQQMTGEARANRTRELLVRLLQVAAAQAPKLLVIDDAHWLDSSSWALLHQVYQQVHPLLTIVVTRPLEDDEASELTRLMQVPDVAVFELDTLPPEAALEIVRQRLGVEDLPESVAALLQSRAEGHPFFTEELAYALRDSGVIEVRDGQCVVTAPGGDLSDVSFPGSIEGVITSRIDVLSPFQQLTLKAASVIGRVFELDMVTAIYPQLEGRSAIPDHLATLERVDITPVHTGAAGADSYMFKHILTREVAYNLMLFAQREGLHLKVAQWLEQEHAHDLAAQYALLAHHWDMARSGGKALRYLELAGGQALREGAYRESIGFFGRALELAGDEQAAVDRDRQAHWQRNLGYAYYAIGEPQRGEEHLERALQLLGRPAPKTPLPLALGTLSQLLLQFAHRLTGAGRVRSERAAADGVTGLTPSTGGPGDPERVASTRAQRLVESALACETLGLVSYFGGNTERVLYLGLRALNLAEAAGPSAVLGRSYASIGIVAGFVPIHKTARNYLQRAADMVAAAGTDADVAWVQELAGVYATGIGDWSGGGAALDAATTTFKRIGDHRRWDECTASKGFTAYLRADLARCEELYREINVSARRRGDQQYTAISLSGIAAALLRQGSDSGRSEALEHLLEAEQILTASVEDKPWRVWVAGLQAEARLHDGDVAAAASLTETTAALLKELGRPSAVHLVSPLATVSGMYLRWAAADPAGDQLSDPVSTAAAATAAADACRALNAFAAVFPVGGPVARLRQGYLLLLRNQAGKAARAWQASRQLAAELQMPLDEALASVALAVHGAGEPSERRRSGEAAVATLRRIGAEREAAQAGAALAAQTT